MIKYIPNILTSFRIVVAFLIPFLFFSKNHQLLTILLIIALLTDLFDGFLARKLKAISVSGKLLDIISDKLLALSAASTFITFINNFLLLVLIGEIAISVLMSYFFITSGAYKEKDFTKHESSQYGKIKTWFLFITLGVAFISYEFIAFQPILQPLIILTFIIQIITFCNYLKIYGKK